MRTRRSSSRPSPEPRRSSRRRRAHTPPRGRSPFPSPGKEAELDLTARVRLSRADTCKEDRETKALHKYQCLLSTPTLQPERGVPFLELAAQNVKSSRERGEAAIPGAELWQERRQVWRRREPRQGPRRGSREETPPGRERARVLRLSACFHLAVHAVPPQGELLWLPSSHVWRALFFPRALGCVHWPEPRQTDGDAPQPPRTQELASSRSFKSSCKVPPPLLSCFRPPASRGSELQPNETNNGIRGLFIAGWCW